MQVTMSSGDSAFTVSVIREAVSDALDSALGVTWQTEAALADVMHFATVLGARANAAGLVPCLNCHTFTAERWEGEPFCGACQVANPAIQQMLSSKGGGSND